MKELITTIACVSIFFIGCVIIAKSVDYFYNKSKKKKTGNNKNGG